MKYFIKQIIALYSDEKSYFSKKRVESGISFFLGQLGMLLFLFTNYTTMQTSDILLWATLEFTVSGYILTHIQNEKEKTSNNPI